MSLGKCDRCNDPATVLVTEIKGGKRVEKRLCEHCAVANEGPPGKAQPPIEELLTNFVMAHSSRTGEKNTCENYDSETRVRNLIQAVLKEARHEHG
jgi:protein-arginine kinase activator protein McsA